MARTPKITVELVDVNGSFARLIREAPKKARQFLSTAVFQTTAAVHRGMEAAVPVDQGDLRNALEFTHRGLHGKAGVLNDPEQAAVAQFNEYAPNKQPFMRPAAEQESNAFKSRAERALAQMERALTVSGF